MATRPWIALCLGWNVWACACADVEVSTPPARPASLSSTPLFFDRVLVQDSTQNGGDRQGSSVALAGDRLVSGAPADDRFGADAGSVTIFAQGRACGPK
jgi:hypothetical protein